MLIDYMDFFYLWKRKIDGLGALNGNQSLARGFDVVSWLNF